MSTVGNTTDDGSITPDSTPENHTEHRQKCVYLLKLERTVG
ncbi:MAG: hypothetical protein ACFB14_04490 [Leptolyngbyaceae cyanobacterium]